MKTKKKKKPPYGSRAEFIRSQPLDMPADEVVARGEKAGLFFPRNTVDSTRSKMRAKSASVAVPPPQTPPALEAARGHAAEYEPLTAAAFVRSLPMDMPAAEVVAKGAEAGLNVSVASVHTTRFVENQKKKKTGVGRGGHMRGSSPRREFIRGLPLDMPTEEVTARAEAAGIELTKQHVHQARFDMRRRQAPETARESAGAVRSAARVSRAPREPKDTGDPVRAAKRLAFKALILELGMDDAESIWEDFASIRNGIRR